MRILFSVLVFLFLLPACRNDKLEELHPATPVAAADPRDKYIGNYQFTVTYHNVVFVMGSDTTYTEQYNGLVTKLDTNLYSISYSVYDSVVGTKFATDASQFVVSSGHGTATGSFTPSGQDTVLDLSYIRSQSPSHLFSVLLHGQKQ